MGAEQTQVFISYSRKDSEFALHLRDRLLDDGFEAYLDVEDIVKGEPWRERLNQLIEAADAIVFLVSPTSVASPVCDWEINQAELLAKRVLPVICKPIPDESVPQRLKRLNYTFLDAEEKWPAEYPKLTASLRVDARLVREHTRLGELAKRWERQKRSRYLLLRGKAIAAAESWRDEVAPTSIQPSKLHLEYIAASRKFASQLLRVGILVSIAAAASLTGLSIYANLQRDEAERQRNAALTRLAETHWKNGILYRDQLGLATVAAHWFAKAAASPDPALADSARLAATQAIRSVTLRDITQWDGADGGEDFSTTDCAKGYEVELKGRTASVRRIADGDQLPAAWVCQSGDLPPITHDKFVRGVCVRTTAAQLVSWGDDSSVRVWEPCEDHEKYRFMHENWVLGATLNRGESEILSWSKDRTVRAWSLGEPHNPLAVFIGRHDDEVTGAAYVAGDRVISWGRDRTVRVWDRQSGRRAVAELHHDRPVSKVRIGADGRQIDSLDDGNTLRTWDIDDGSGMGPEPDLLSVELRQPAGTKVLGARFLNYGKRVVTWDDKKMLRLWGIEQGVQQLSEKEAHSKRINAVYIFGDEKQLLSWSKKEVRLWHISDDAQLKPRSPEKCTVELAGVEVDSRKDLLLAWSSDGNVWIRSLADQDGKTGLCKLIPEPDPEMRAVSGAVFDADATRVLTWSVDNTFSVWRIDGSELLRPGNFIPFPQSIMQALFSPDGTQVLLSLGGGADRSSIRLCDLKGRDQTQPDCLLTGLSYDGKIADIQFSPDGKQVAGITARGELFVIAVDDWSRLRSMNHPLDSSMPATVRPGVMFDPSGFRVLSWTNQGEVRLWDLATGDQVVTGMLHGRNLLGALADPEGRRVLSWGGKDQGARIWNFDYDARQPSVELEQMVAARTGTRMTSQGELEVLDANQWNRIEAEDANTPDSP